MCIASFIALVDNNDTPILHVCSIPNQPKCCRSECGKHEDYKPDKDMVRWGKVLPLLEMLETNRKMEFKQNLENRGEIRKIQALTKFGTETDMEERRMDLEKKSDKLVFCIVLPIICTLFLHFTGYSKQNSGTFHKTMIS